MVNKGVVFIGDVSGNLASITTSGQVKVDATVTATANISGQPVQISGQTVVANVVTNISGQTVYIPNDGVNNVVSISGQTVVASVTTNISGQTIYTTSGQNNVQMSGQSVRLPNDQVNNVVWISGQVVTASVTTNISGQVVAISGSTIYFVDDSVNNKVKISGQLVAVSGSIAIGNVPNVLISGGALSGLTVSISGQPVVASVTTNISGQTIYTVSGNNAVTISGEPVRLVSGFNLVRLEVGGNSNVMIRGFNESVVANTVSGGSVDDISPITTAYLRTSNILHGYDSNADQWARLRVTASGDGFRLITSVSGQPISFIDDSVNNRVKISGQLVAVSGLISVGTPNVIVSGGALSGLTVSISGQPVVASVTTNISGQVVAVSGSVIYLVDDSVNNKVKISGQLVAVSGSIAVGNTPNVIISGGALSGLTVSISGQPVVASVTTNISGQTVYTASGQNAVQISGQAVLISGQTVVANVVTNISGQTTYLPNDGVNNVVSISGQTVVASVVTNISGQVVAVSGSTVYFIDDSVNNKVKISGQLVAVSGVVNVGNTVTVTIGTQPVDTLISGGALSGVRITSISGSVTQISGQLVAVSGIIILDPTVPQVSGDAIRFTNDSVNNVVRMSGQLVAVSGIVNIGVAASLVSGNVVRVSGETVSVSGVVTALVSGGISVSGNAVKVSGESVRHGIPTIFRTRAVLTCTAASGGSVCLSGDVRKATFINAGVSGQNIWLGSTTDPPFSGKGLYLTPGNGVTIEINNFSTIQACSVVSGALLSYGGEQY